MKIGIIIKKHSLCQLNVTQKGNKSVLWAVWGALLSVEYSNTDVRCLVTDHSLVKMAGLILNPVFTLDAVVKIGGTSVSQHRHRKPDEVQSAHGHQYCQWTPDGGLWLPNGSLWWGEPATAAWFGHAVRQWRRGSWCDQEQAGEWPSPKTENGQLATISDADIDGLVKTHHLANTAHQTKWSLIRGVTLILLELCRAYILAISCYFFFQKTWRRLHHIASFEKWAKSFFQWTVVSPPEFDCLRSLLYPAREKRLIL